MGAFLRRETCKQMTAQGGAACGFLREGRCLGGPPGTAICSLPTAGLRTSRIPQRGVESRRRQVSGGDSVGGRELTVWGPGVCEKRRSGLEMPARLCRAGLFRNCALTESCVQNTRLPAACQPPCLGAGKRGSGGTALPPPGAFSHLQGVVIQGPPACGLCMAVVG